MTQTLLEESGARGDVHTQCTYGYDLMEVGSMTKLWNAIRTRRVLAIAVGVLLVGGLGTSAAVFVPGLLSSKQPTNAANVSAPVEVTPTGFTEFRSAQAGFALSYPAAWSTLNVKDPQVLLLASQGPQDSFLVRALELPEPVGAEQLPAAKKVTDEIVTSNKTVKMITEPKQIQMAGLPGFFYFYSFQDPATKQEGAHSHFFLFNGKTMISLVFQTVPMEKFASSAQTFDQITESFHLLQK